VQVYKFTFISDSKNENPCPESVLTKLNKTLVMRSGVKEDGRHPGAVFFFFLEMGRVGRGNREY
jgi:hypothetical protein